MEGIIDSETASVQGPAEDAQGTVSRPTLGAYVAVTDVRVKCRRTRIRTKAALSALFRLFVWLDEGAVKNFNTAHDYGRPRGSS